MTSTDTRLCPLCRDGRFASWKLGLIQCMNCGLVVSRAIFTEKANEQKNKEWFGEDDPFKRSFWVSRFEAWNNIKTFARLDRAHIRGRRLLEIGVGSGSFLNAARKKKFDVLGCDLSMAICERVRRLHSIDMHCGPLETLEADRFFDVVVMRHLLEHAQRPISFLLEALQRLVPGGIAYITVPNVACWEARFRGWTSFVPYHLAYFTPQTLRRALISSGFQILKIKTGDSFSGWFLALLRTFMGVNREEGQVAGSAESLVSHGTAYRSFGVENVYYFSMVLIGISIYPLRFIQSVLGYGDEIICIAQKNFN